MERMGALDATFLAVEDAVNHMHIGSVCVFEGPPPSREELAARVAGKLALVPRYRQKVRTAPGAVGRPVWVDDPHFRLDYHLRTTALPRPGGEAELVRLVGRVMSQRLDRDRPLWESWLVEGLPGDGWALLSKVHHCMVDGIAGTDLLAVILDADPDAPVPEPAPWMPRPEPSSAALAWASLSGLASAPLRRGRALAASLRRPDLLARRLAGAARGTTELGAALLVPRPSPLVGSIGPHRVWLPARVLLDDVKRVRKELGGTVNDVVLAMVTRGFRDMLADHGDLLEGHTVRTLVPVSVRGDDGRGVYDNRVAALLAALPVGVDDPRERFSAVRAELDRLKASGEAAASEVVIGAADVVPPTLSALAARVLVHQQRQVETVTTNVPGPQFPLYCCGRRMLDAYPYVPIAGQIRVAVAIWSYCGNVFFGVTADDRVEGDLDVTLLRDGIVAGLDELLAASP
jgi:WS/DGAT/MGAT family acyltransferase